LLSNGHFPTLISTLEGKSHRNCNIKAFVMRKIISISNLL
jgi:hypothetical protein